MENSSRLNRRILHRPRRFPIFILADRMTLPVDLRLYPRVSFESELSLLKKRRAGQPREWRELCLPAQRDVSHREGIPNWFPIFFRDGCALQQKETHDVRMSG